MNYRIDRLESTDSTNEEIKRKRLAGAGEGLVVVSNSQTAGKGRKGRCWHSPAGRNLYFSLLLCPDCAPDEAPMLTIVMALAVNNAIQALGIQSKIKWPNDITVEGKKVCGILTEMLLAGTAIDYVVVGVGINVDGQDFLTHDLPHATGLCDAGRSLAEGAEVQVSAEDAEDCILNGTGMQKGCGMMPLSPEKLLEDILERFEGLYHIFLKSHDLSGLKDAYEAYLVNLDRQVRILEPAGAYEGIARGINEKGELLVETEDGMVRSVFAGEVSVRGIYDYV